MTPAQRGQADRETRSRSVAALVDHSWAAPDPVRPAARLHVVMMVVALVSAAAVGVGAVSQLVDPVALAQSLPTPPPPIDDAPFVAVSGWDCPQGADVGFDAAGRTSGWRTVARGGWAEDGCHGAFAAIPMSGDPAADDPEVFAVWWFTPPPVFTRCAIAVFVADAERPEDSAAGAARYAVLDSRGGQRLAEFVLDQRAHRGSWVDVGTFPLGSSGIAVRLGNRGVAAAAGDRLALTQVRATCSA